jgi:hypothetical protein
MTPGLIPTLEPAMSLRVDCPVCRTPLELPDDHRGLMFRCPSCNQPFRIGAPAPANSPALVARRDEPAAEPARERVARREAPPPPPRRRMEPAAPARQPDVSRGPLPLVIAALAGAVVGSVLTAIPLLYLLSRKPAEVAALRPQAAEAPVEKPVRATPPAKDSTLPEKPAPPEKPVPPAAPAVAWKDITSEESRFSVRFPGEPKLTTAKDSAGTTTLTYALDRAETGSTFMVLCSAVPPGSENLPPKLFLDAMAKQLGKSAKSQKDLLLDGHPGLELQLEEDRGGTKVALTQRVYLARGRIYQVIAGGPPGKPDPAAGPFLDSFKLLDKADTKSPPTPSVEAPPSKPPETPPVESPPAVTKPVQIQLVETIRVPAGGSLADSTVAWVKKNNAFGPDHKLVKDVTAKFASDVKENWGFSLALGRKLTKSRKPTLMGGWNGSVFVFECDAEQPAALRIPDDAMAFRGIAQGVVQRDKQPVTLSDLKVNNAGALGLDEKITGSVAYKKTGEAKGTVLLLRLTYLAGDAVRTKLHFIGPTLKGESGTINFSYGGVGAADWKFHGPLVLFFEVYEHTGQIERQPVLSSPVAAAVVVKPGGFALGGGTPPVAAPRPKADGLGGLEAKLPTGWKSEYSKFLRSWTFEKYTPGASGLNESNRLRVSTFLDGPTTAEDYAEKLKKKDFVDIEYVFTTITAKEKLPDGFIIQGEVSNYKSAKEKPRLGLVMVRDLGGVPVICQSTSLRSEELRKEAIALFGSAKLGKK